jgi:uncharacterized protein
MQALRYVLVIGGLAFSLAAFGTSFNCKEARSQIEKRVCANPDLSSFDERLSETYRNLLAVSPAPDDLKELQRQWVRGTRDVCSKDACIASAYKSRLSELEKQLSRLPFKPNLTQSLFMIPAQKKGEAIVEASEVQKSDKVELIGRLEFGHDAAGGRIDFVKGKASYTVRYVWQISEEENVLMNKWEESGEYLLVKAHLTTLKDGSKRIDDRFAVEIYGQ